MNHVYIFNAVLLVTIYNECCLELCLRLEPTCAVEIPLVSGPFPIPDLQMTASSEFPDPDKHFPADHGACQARLHNTNGAGAWCPTWEDRDAPTLNMFIQVSTQGNRV